MAGTGTSSGSRHTLRAAEARELVAAQARYDKFKRAAEDAKEERDRLLARARPKVPEGEWITVGGWVIRITMQRGGDRFRLGDYVKAGNKLTARMREFVTIGDSSPRLWIKPAA